MPGYIVRRCLTSLLLIWLVLSVAFIALDLAPGDPTDRLIEPRASREQVDRLKAVYGFDQPWPSRYVSWLRAAVTGDWGISFIYLAPVRSVLADLLPPSLLLASAALVLQYCIGLLLGLAAALRPNGLIDHSLRLLSTVLYSFPTFWLALIALLVLSHSLRLFPPGQMVSPLLQSADWWTQTVDVSRHLVLPACALGLPLSVPVARLLRGTMLDTLSEQFMQTARARGLPSHRLVWHALRCSLVPLVQLFGLSLPVLVGGAAVVELVFSWPGIGSAMVDAIRGRDYPLALAITGLSSVLVILGNLLADIATTVVDPRTESLR